MSSLLSDFSPLTFFRLLASSELKNCVNQRKLYHIPFAVMVYATPFCVCAFAFNCLSFDSQSKKKRKEFSRTLRRVKIA